MARSPLFFHTVCNVSVELSFTARGTYANPPEEVSLDAVFVDPEGRELRVPAFWAGGQVWKVRYASPVAGEHRFRLEGASPEERGWQGVQGAVQVMPYEGENVLFRRGPVRVAADRRHFEHADGTPFFWLGDTWWMGLCERLRWPEDFQTLTADRKEKGFNVVQIVAGLYPDMPAFDPRGANEAGFPWEPEYARLRPEYFDAVDRRLAYLIEQGITPCLVGAWGYFLPWMGAEKMKAHWRYLIARYGSWPVVWCAGGEANLPWYLAKHFPSDDREQVHGWTEILRYIRATDPFRRPLTIHPTAINRYTARNATDDAALLDFDLLQTPHAQNEAVEPTIRTVRESYADTPRMPVIDGEPCYEMLMGTITTAWPRRMFWSCLLNGAAGHTYGANGIWQVNRADRPHGASPHGGDYGQTPWDEAMRFAGSRQVSLGKQLLERYEWTRFRPHPEWASFAGEIALGLDGARWIWSVPADTPVPEGAFYRRYFRREFELPAERRVVRGRLRFAGMNHIEARVNGEVAGVGWNRVTGSQFEDLARLMRPGRNALAIWVEHRPPTKEPVGFLAALELQFADGGTLRITTDETWRMNESEVTGWQRTEFDASGWAHAVALGWLGDAPWGAIAAPDMTYFGPQAAGIPGVVRIHYVPLAEPVRVQHLGAGRSHAARIFDPVTGASTELGTVRADAAGEWRCAPPAGADHDWVLVLEPMEERSESAVRKTRAARGLTLTSEEMEWQLDWTDGRLHTTRWVNKLSGTAFALSRVTELALVFSAAADRIAEPRLRVAEFAVRGARITGAGEATVELRAASPRLDVTLHVALEGGARRKWIEVTNRTRNELLLLDAELDDFTTEASVSGGGAGQPVFLEDEVFAAIEHPAGENLAERGRVRLAHFPGRRLAPGATWRSHPAVVSVTAAGAASAEFLRYIEARSRPRPAFLSCYTPFGINNQWGAAPTLDDEQTLDVLGLLERWRTEGVHFDYFTLDTGWVDFGSDLTQFRPGAYPHGPDAIVRRVRSLRMKFGLWFATSWGLQSCWDYPGAFKDGAPPVQRWREGFPLGADGLTFCFGEENYFSILKNAVLHHVRENGVRFLKFDGGWYQCDDAGHGHLPGKYATEAMYEKLIDLAESAREAAPDVFVMWYWGLRSPFWALHGDAIFESGLQMEGSGTSATPTLYYRDSVTLAQDQNARHATTIPPRLKDSLGVWLADTRWGNFMGMERWRESLVMDLGRGSRLFPNLWGDLYRFAEDDLRFLAWIAAFARENAELLAERRVVGGDPFHNDVYGYAYGRGRRALVFLYNAHFAARPIRLRLDRTLGLDDEPAEVHVLTRFPDEERVRRPDGAEFKLGDALELWLRPFETLMIEVTGARRAGAGWPVRRVSSAAAREMGVPLTLRPGTIEPAMDVIFADATAFEAKGWERKSQAFETTLPALAGEGQTWILAVVIQLKQGEAEWSRVPTVVQIVQTIIRVNGRRLLAMPVPDGRQHGNTQSYGCSWVVYKVRVPAAAANAPVRIAVHAHLPAAVEAKVQAWVVERWWREDARPAPDGYYTYAPS